ncbi:MAG: type II toxin-antitoxin system ParD family antitoxin [Pyrinomonadaceae bacterium]|nr:type II toxin-antitoxin system ParD family antitoxin [Pyrinomonadaceae bacterium]
MIITLPTEIEKIVVEKVSNGGYKSVDEVISKSVRLLEAKEKGIQALRDEIMRGFDSIESGQFSEFSTDEELENFSDDVIRQARERRGNSKD